MDIFPYRTNIQRVANIITFVDIKRKIVDVGKAVMAERAFGKQKDNW